jgi:Ca2+-binding EF-hand superfamily protein
MSKKFFDVIDMNNNKTLTKKEMEALLKASSESPTTQMEFSIITSEIETSPEKALLDALDANSDGRVTFDEWHTAITTAVFHKKRHTSSTNPPSYRRTPVPTTCAD